PEGAVDEIAEDAQEIERGHAQPARKVRAGLDPEFARPRHRFSLPSPLDRIEKGGKPGRCGIPRPVRPGPAAFAEGGRDQMAELLSRSEDPVELGDEAGFDTGAADKGNAAGHSAQRVPDVMSQHRPVVRVAIDKARGFRREMKGGHSSTMPLAAAGPASGVAKLMVERTDCGSPHDISTGDNSKTQTSPGDHKAANSGIVPLAKE